MKYLKYYLLSALIIALDQGVKLWVYQYMQMGYNGEIKILGDLFKLHYTLNPGMAMGIGLDWLGLPDGKLFLTLFRILAVFAIGYYLYTLIEKNTNKGFLWCIALILGGAIGNVLDSTFYGVILNNAPYGVSTPWFHGQVIDMFYIDIWEGYLPSWIPIVGGQYYSFWPIFNVADASIFVSVCVILIFQKRFFNETGIISENKTIDENSLKAVDNESPTSN
ncbi:MAG: lipoprotein signal peptidase [Bacteroidota bacterium]|nr:lipoprotein signal peptidase [Bacteroidota bacterium]